MSSSGGEPDVERHDDARGSGRGEVAFQQLMGIEAQIGHAVAGEDAFGKQSEGQAFARVRRIRRR